MIDRAFRAETVRWAGAKRYRIEHGSCEAAVIEVYGQERG